jgi:hypothetical protein
MIWRNIIDDKKASEILTRYKKDELIGKNLFDVGLLPKSELNKVLYNIH